MNWKRSIVLFPLILAALCWGCTARRPARSQAELMELRKVHDAQYTEMSRDAVRQLMEIVKARYDPPHV